MLLVADRVEVLSNTQSLACLSCTKNCYQLDYVQARRPIQVQREAWCGLYGKAPESVDHIMSGCDALAQSKYLSMTYCLMWDAYIVDAVPPLYCLVKPRPVYESDDVKAYWDVPGFAQHEDVTTESSITRPSGSLHSQ